MANKENIQKWVDALRSGEFSQTKGALSRLEVTQHKEEQLPVGNCCLGVACEISGVVKSTERPTKWSDKDLGYYDGTSEFLPNSVKQWLGFRNDNPCVKTEKGWKPLAELNDEGLDFVDISDLIQKTYL